MTVIRSIFLALIIGAVVTQIAHMCTTVYLHRALSHRALTVRRPVAFVFRFLLWITTGIKPKEWVAVHRKHHAFTDMDGDPHSPVLLGWRRVQISNVKLYRDTAAQPETITRYAKDLPDDVWDRLFFGHHKTGLALGISILVVVFGPFVGLLAAVIHMNYYLAANAAVNALGHHFGRRPYENGATNLQWLALLTLGEGLHNNHHAAPSTARLAHRWYEVDLGWWIIRGMTFLRMATLRFDGIRLLPPSRATATNPSA